MVFRSTLLSGPNNVGLKCDVVSLGGCVCSLSAFSLLHCLLFIQETNRLLTRHCVLTYTAWHDQIIVDIHHLSYMLVPAFIIFSIFMVAEGKAIIFYRGFFISSAYMKDQPWDLNQTWPVGRKWCRFTNAPLPKKIGALPKIWGAKNIKFFTTFFATSTLDTAYLQNETLHRQTKMLVSIYSMSRRS